MTRVNVVPVTELCDQHLLAEHREITRIPKRLLTGKLRYEYDDRPDEYTLGRGHIKFFTNKLRWLYYRWAELHEECRFRGFNVQWTWPKIPKVGEDKPVLDLIYWNDWKVTPMALRINRARIRERMPANAKWTQKS